MIRRPVGEGSRRLWWLCGALALSLAGLVVALPWRQRVLSESARFREREAEAAAAEQGARQQEAALSSLTAELARRPWDASLRLQAAGLQWAGSGPSAAMRVLDSAPRPFEDARLPQMLADAARLAGREDRALAALEEAARTFPRDGQVRAARGMLLTLLGWHRDADRELRLAERWGSDTAFLGRATLARARGDFAGARRLLETGRARRPDDAEVIRQLADLAEAQQRYEEATQLWESLPRLAPAASDRLTLAGLYLRTRDRALVHRALEEAEWVLQARPAYGQARYVRARCFDLLGRTAEARSELEALRREAPRLVGVGYHLAEIYRKEGRQAEAVALLRDHARALRQRSALRRAATAVMRSPDDAKAHLEVGRHCLERGLPGRAIVEAERALQLKPGLPGAGDLLRRARVEAEHRPAGG